MAMNRIQFQASLSAAQFIELYGTEQKCEVARGTERAGLMVSRCPRCEGQEYGSSLAGAQQALSSAGAVVIKHPHGGTILEQQSYL